MNNLPRAETVPSHSLGLCLRSHGDSLSLRFKVCQSRQQVCASQPCFVSLPPLQGRGAALQPLGLNQGSWSQRSHRSTALPQPAQGCGLSAALAPCACFAMFSNTVASILKKRGLPEIQIYSSGTIGRSGDCGTYTVRPPVHLNCASSLVSECSFTPPLAYLTFCCDWCRYFAVHADSCAVVWMDKFLLKAGVYIYIWEIEMSELYYQAGAGKV